MAGLNIVVLVKGVPDFREGKVQFKDDNTLNRGATPTVLNPNDHNALEAARELQVKHGGTVSLLTMGPPNYSSILAEGLEWAGDRVFLLTDRKFAAADTWATSFALSYAIRKIEEEVGSVDMILAGFKSADGETGQTGPQTALQLDLPIITHVTDLAVDPENGNVQATRLGFDEIETCETSLPTFIVTDPGFEPSYRKAAERLDLLDHKQRQAERAANERAVADKEDDRELDSILTAWSAEDVNADDDRIGLSGSPTIVRQVEHIPVPPSEREALVIEGSSDEDVEKVAKLIIEKLEGGA